MEVQENPIGRFVILRHEGTPQYKPGVHWDLMLECDGELKTWAVEQLPNLQHSVDAEQLPDHRLAYLEYEGPVSGNRGTVARFDSGQFEMVGQSDERWIVSLSGEKLRGRMTLFRADRTSRWLCTLTAT